jgi:hypothetical protein
MYIVLLQGGKLYRHLSVPFDLFRHLDLGFLCFFFFFGLDELSIVDRGVLKSPIISVLRSICGFKSFSECLMKLESTDIGACKLIIVISS